MRRGGKNHSRNGVKRGSERARREWHGGAVQDRSNKDAKDGKRAKEKDRGKEREKDKALPLARGPPQI